MFVESVTLLCCASPAPSPSIRHQRLLPLSGGVVCALKTRLRQLHPGQFPVYQLVFRLRRYDHVTDALATLHWLRLPRSVDFKVAVMVFRVLHGLEPQYLNQLARVADLPSRCRLRSTSSHQLLVSPFRLTTVGRRTFPVAASLLWNSLPSDIQASSYLSAFRQSLKTFHFRQSFPDIIL